MGTSRNQKIMTEKTTVKLINWEQKEFEANGKKYTIYGRMSIARAVYAEVAKMEMGAGQTFGKTFETLSQVYELLNTGEVADAAVKIYNSLRAFDTFVERPLPVLRISACYLNTEGEDLTTMSDELAAKKVEDWAAEGYALESFFLFAMATIRAEAEELANLSSKASEAMAKLVERMKAGEFTPIPESLS